MRGESADGLSRELALEISSLEERHQEALRGIETALKSRKGDLLAAQLKAAV
jgi:hypothetical protein